MPPMDKLHNLQVIATLCILLTLHTFVNAGQTFTLEGRVYCDTCRAGFETSASQYIEGAKVKMECRNFETNEIIHTAEGVTDKTGTYKIQVDDDHQEEICEVILLASPVKGCSEIYQGRDRARVAITGNNGIVYAVRQVNSLGFIKEEPLHLCGLLLQQYALGTDE